MFTVEVFSNNVSTGVDFIVSSPFNQPVQKVLSSPSDRQSYSHHSIEMKASLDILRDIHRQWHPHTVRIMRGLELILHCIKRSPVNHPVRYSVVRQSLGQSESPVTLVEMEVTLDMPRGVK